MALGGAQLWRMDWPCCANCCQNCWYCPCLDSSGQKKSSKM